MLGLVSYDSDEEEETQQQEDEEAPQPTKTTIAHDPSKKAGQVAFQDQSRGGKPLQAMVEDEKESTGPTASTYPTKVTIPHSPSRPVFSVPAPAALLQPPDTSTSVADDAPIVGPALGPTLPSTAGSPYPSYASPSPTPLSPYSLNRSQIQSLTLPHAIPPIPPSPPGTPPPEISSKFNNFLTLKRQGVHFNEKLSRSSALRNPRLLEKLMGFVGLDVEIGDPEAGGKWSANQYVSGLPKEAWDPEGWENYKEGFVEELRRSQHKIVEKKQRKAEEDAARGVPRAGLAFVGEKGTDFGAGGRKESGVGRAVSAAERVMAGLDRSERNTPAARGSSGDSVRRGGREGYDRDRDRRGRGGGGDDHYRNRDRDRDGERDRDRDRERDRDRDRDRRKYNRSRSRSRSRDRERYRR